MIDASPILKMPYIQPSQAQKHVTHNEALSKLDMIVQLAVLAADQAIPPATAVEGDRYLVAENAQAAWAGHDHQIAVFVSAGWEFVVPLTGWVAQDIATGHARVYDGSRWATPLLNNLPGVGIGAEFDPHNKLVVASDAVLLNNAGAGHQLKVNKANASDTASLLFQTGYGGRAELGTAGNDDFSLKVSADGINWAEALRVDAESGRVTAGVSGWREKLDGPRIYYVDQTLGDDTGEGTGLGVAAFSTIAHAVEAALSVDSGGFDITLQLNDGVHNLIGTVRADVALVGGGALIIRGNEATPELVTISTNTVAVQIKAGTIALRGLRFENSDISSPAIQVAAPAFLSLANVRFSGIGGHIDAAGGRVEADGPYAITANAPYHLRLSKGAVFDGKDHTVTLENTPNFADAFLMCAETSVAHMTGQSFGGSATGKRFEVSTNAVVLSGGGVLPGSVAGSVESGGIVV